MRFGFDERKRMTGAGLYTRVFQISALLPVVYIFLVSGYPAIVTRPGVFSVLFDLGISALPRAMVLALSYLYRLTSSEILVHFAILIVAFIFGIVFHRLLTGAVKTARTARMVAAVLIGADILLRLVPARWNAAFGLPAAIAGLVIRLGCLALIIMDLRAEGGASGRSPGNT